MGIDLSQQLEHLCSHLKPDAEARYLTIDTQGNIKRSQEKCETTITEIFNLIFDKIQEADDFHYCSNIRCCDDHLLHLEGIEQHTHYYYGRFVKKTDNPLFSLFFRCFNGIHPTQSAYNSLLYIINSRRTQIIQQKDRLQIQEILDCVFDDNRIANNELPLDELFGFTHLALNAADASVQWREENRVLLEKILNIVSDAADTAQLSAEQIETLVDPIKKLDSFFGEKRVWTTISVENKETNEMEEKKIPILSLLAGPQNNLLIS